MVSFDLVLQTAVSLHPEGEPSAFISEYTGYVRCCDEGKLSRVGKVHAYRIHAGLALDLDQPLFDVCDAHSQALHDVFEAVFDSSEEDFKERVACEFQAIDSDCLVIDYVVLHPKWRGLRLGLLAVRRLVELLGGGCGLVVAEILPLRPGSHRLLKVPASWIPPKSKATAKLRRYFGQMGFRHIAGSYYGLSMVELTPKAAELLMPCR